MLKVKTFSMSVLPVLLMCLFLACGSSASAADNSGSAASQPAGGTSGAAKLAPGKAMSDAALERMDAAFAGGQGQPPAGGTSKPAPAPAPAAPAPTPAPPAPAVVSVSSGAKPLWVDDPYRVYAEKQYLAFTGLGISRDVAEQKAISSLVSYFGQSVQTDTKIKETYQEMMKNGSSDWSAGTSSESNIQTSAALDNLVGAEIREVWLDSKTKNYYAVVVMDKAKTSQVYIGMINDNQTMINNLLSMSAAEKNSLDGFSRYQLAATVADVNAKFAGIVSLLGGTLPAGLKKGDDYRLEAVNITKTIPVGVTVKNDKAGRIQGAFTKALSDLGFRSGGKNARYVMEVDVNISPVDLKGNPNVFARYEVSARLTDTSEGTVLMPYDINGREGHTSQSEADNRAYAAAEKKINAEYKGKLQDYLSSLLPSR